MPPRRQLVIDVSDPPSPYRETARPLKRRRLELDVGAIETRDDFTCFSRPAPKTRAQLWSWAAMFLLALSSNSFGQDFVRSKHGLVSKFCHGVLISTDFSAEIAGASIVETIRNNLGFAGQGLQFFRAGVIKESCRRALMLHGESACAPSCVFGDAMDRVPGEIQLKVKALWAAAQTKMANSVHAGWSQKVATEKAGKRFLFKAAKIMLDLSDTRFYEQAPCFKCKRDCSIKPASGSTSMIGNISGILCYDWSTIGSGKGLMGFASTVLLLLWVRERLASSESWAIAECVRAFNHTVLEQLLGHEFSITVIVVCSSDLGYPCTRARKYMVFLRRRLLQWHSSIASDVLGAFKRMIHSMPSTF